MQPSSLPCTAARLRAIFPWILSLSACAAAGPEPDDSAAPERSAVRQQESADDEREPSRVAVGGTRLLAVYHAAGAAERFVTFHDLSLGIDCDWASIPGGSGGVHCVPARDTRVVYLDAQCTQPAAAVDPPSGVPSAEPIAEGEWVSALLDEGSCTTEPLRARAGYRLGGPVDGSLVHSVGYIRRDGTCSITRLGGTRLRNLVPPPPNTFVQGSLLTDTVNGGLLSQRVFGDDGSKLTAATRLLDGRACHLQLDGRCVPDRITHQHVSWTSNPGDAVVYTDARCEVPAFVDPPGIRCGNAQLGIDVVAGSALVYPLTAIYSAFRREPASGACRPVTVNRGFYAPGADISATFGTGRAVRHGSGPLFVRQIVEANRTSERALAPESKFEDAQGRACAPVPAKDGSLRCFPDRMRVSQAFAYADAQCTDELLYNAGDDVEDSDLMITGDQTFGGPPRALTSLFSVKVYTGTVHRLTEAGCAVSAPFDDAPPLLIRDRELPLSVLPEVKVVTH